MRSAIELKNVLVRLLCLPKNLRFNSQPMKEHQGRWAWLPSRSAGTTIAFREPKRARRSLIDILLVVAIDRNTWAGLAPDTAQIIVLHTIGTQNVSSAFEKVPGETRERHGQDNVKRGTIAYCR
jgi:hypothetical protein